MVHGFCHSDLGRYSEVLRGSVDELRRDLRGYPAVLMVELCVAPRGDSTRVLTNERRG
jgi:hypothetical protein